MRTVIVVALLGHLASPGHTMKGASMGPIVLSSGGTPERRPSSRITYHSNVYSYKVGFAVSISQILIR